MSDFKDQAEFENEEDSELKFVDLPPVEQGTMAEKLVGWGVRLKPIVKRWRRWRVVTTTCTIVMILFLVLTSLPSPRQWLYGLAFLPTSTPDSTDSTTTLPFDSQGRLITNGHTWEVAPRATSGNTPVDTPITPGPVPANTPCPAPVVLDTSSQVGTGPVRLTGFSGPYARVHLSQSIPVPAFPSLYGFPVPIQVEVPATFKDQIMLDGQEMSNGLDVAFGYDLYGPQTPTIVLDPQSQDEQPYTILMNGSYKKVWSITLFLPASDCYILRASWSEGQLITNFLAGR